MSSAPANWEHCLLHAEVTDIGMRRANNQDSHAAVLADSLEKWLQRGHVFMVADGMGAHAAGEKASELAVDGIPFLYQKYLDQSPPEALQRAIVETNAEIHRRGRANTDFHNMGTTCSVLVLLPQGALAAHIGDSRIYRQRGDLLEQLTFDHSIVWEMRAAGQLPEDGELARQIPKNVITRSLGPHPTVQVDIEGPFPLALGDSFLLCSDGLSGQITDEEIGAVLANLPPQEAAQVLVDLANLRGGPDNITVVIAKVADEMLTTAAASAQPLRVGTTVDRPPTSPILWIVAASLLAAALMLALFQEWIPAAATALVGVLALGLGLARQMRPSGVFLGAGKRLGRGPYVQVRCAVGAEFIDKLAEMVAKLRETIIERQLPVDVVRLDTSHERALNLHQAGEQAAAMRELCRAISHTMHELREQSRKRTSDSSVF